jgi:hypothetical protein
MRATRRGLLLLLVVLGLGLATPVAHDAPVGISTVVTAAVDHSTPPGGRVERHLGRDHHQGSTPLPAGLPPQSMPRPDLAPGGTTLTTREPSPQLVQRSAPVRGPPGT